MEPTNTGLIVWALTFVAVYILCDRVASVLKTKYRAEAEVKKKKTDGEMFDTLSTKLVETMQWMHGGLAGDLTRRMAGTTPPMTIDAEGQEANGRAQQRDNGHHRASVPAGFPGATTAQTH